MRGQPVRRRRSNEQCARLELRAEQIADEKARKMFLTSVPENARTFELAREWTSGR
jgi:hypothetical protein